MLVYHRAVQVVACSSKNSSHFNDPLFILLRYPYYIIRIYSLGESTIAIILTWLRYTVWIPLYPLGFFCEGIVILR